VGFATGGSADFAARILGDELSRLVGTRIVFRVGSTAWFVDPCGEAIAMTMPQIELTFLTPRLDALRRWRASLAFAVLTAP